MKQFYENNVFVREQQNDTQDHICYIHGLGESGLCFEQIMTHPDLQNLSHHAPDLPGYGKSPWPGNALNLHELADFYIQWLESKFDKPVILAGHSMGGVIGIYIAQKKPELLSGFINIEGNLTLGDCAFSSVAAAQKIHEFRDAGFDLMRNRIYEDGLTDYALRGYYASLRMASPVQFHLNSVNLIEASRTETLIFDLANLKLPMIYAAGIPHGIADKSLVLLDKYQIKVTRFNPSGHWPFIDQAAEFIQFIKKFLDREKQTI